MRVTKMVVIAGMLIALYGCISVGRPFDSDDLSWLRKNKTTKDDVYEELGDPFRAGSDSGRLTWTYGYYKYSAFGSTRTKDLVIYFNKDGTVESYTFSTSFPDEKEMWKEKK